MRLGEADVHAAHRLRVAYWLLLGVLCVLVGRAGFLQIVEGDAFRARARAQHFARIAVPAARGRILDRNGRVLAASYHALTIALDPCRVDDPGVTASRLAVLLDEPQRAPDLAARIEKARAAHKRFLFVKRRVNREVGHRIEEADLAGLDVREEPRRTYPQGETAAALVGAVGEQEVTVDGRSWFRIHGLSGLEEQCNQVLEGVCGESLVLRAGGVGRRALHLFPDCEREPVPGRDVTTTIDLRLQEIAEEALDHLQDRFHPKSSCALVMDPQTGEVLAMAGRPGFSPSRFPDVDPAALAIPAIQCAYEPGSVMKPFVMAGALSAGVVHPGEEFDCGPGYKRFGRRLLHDSSAHGTLSLSEVLVESSNIGMAQVGLALGIDGTYSLLQRFGFGHTTGIQLGGEAEGKVTPRAKWDRNYALVSVSMGHQIQVTPIQLATAVCALINGGRRFVPTILQNAPRPAPRKLGLSAAALSFVRDAMVRVVEEGTGKNARVPGVAVGGKTGTSRKYQGTHSYVSSFVGFAPADHPSLVVLVVADEPVRADGGCPYGGVVSAPAVAEILSQGLPLRDLDRQRVQAEFGFRSQQELCDSKESTFRTVRVAAVYRSGVCNEDGFSSQKDRNPDSAGTACRRGAR